jgi:vitamin B12 transporter
MMTISPGRAVSACLCISVFTLSHTWMMMSASAQSAAGAPPAMPAQQAGVDIVLTPNRVPTAIQRAGSAISVVTGAEIARSSPGGVIDALRALPGINVTESGGPGALSAIYMRGGSVGQTLVLVDGVRVNDPSTPSAEFDFGMIAPTDIDRIEVLRGPQSALYGSDAMGGVINILTKKGEQALRRSIAIEGGSYGTFATRGSASGASGAWRYAASATAFHSDGFSRYGYRLPRIVNALRKPLEKDGADKFGASLRLGYAPNADFSVDASLSHGYSFVKFDSSFADDPYNKGHNRLTNGQVAALFRSSDLLTHKISLFGARTERLSKLSSRTGTEYLGDRYGAELENSLALNRFGTLIFGARTEQERLESRSGGLSDTPPRRLTMGQAQTTHSVFALHQLPVGERFDLSFAGRVDHVDRANTFATYRATAAYRLLETGTKLRASLGTGAKAPTLYQLFSEYGTPSLKPETSIGVDAGVEQSLFADRLKLGLGVFQNRFENLIGFGNTTICARSQIFGCYFNTASARSRGVEASADLTLIEGRASFKASYTFLDAEDSKTHLALIRRPMHSGRIGLALSPIEKLTLTPTLVLIGARKDLDFDANFNTIRVRLAPYARLDLGADYAVTEVFSLYGRVENITDARIEEVRNYGGTGRAYYGGVRATW